MSSAHTYKNLIFTNHAIARMNERSITDDAIYWVLKDPDTVKGDRYGHQSVKFIRLYRDRLYHVVAQHKPKENAWLIVSVWVRGEDDTESVASQIILAPFRIVWWLIRQLGIILFKR